MEKVKMSKKDKTMIFAISVTLMLYVNRIYGMASVNDEDVMTFVKEEDAVDSWICPYISRHLLSLNPLLACCRRYSRGER